jgi:dolichyl-phosphate-mannose-protein mannosyltransferase
LATPAEETGRVTRRPWLPILFFGALLLAHVSVPRAPVFDEITYVPAVKALVTLRDNLNWEHPPLAKLAMGLPWLLLTRLCHLVPEPAVFRWSSIAFGLWALWGVRAWMRELGFSEAAAQAAVWLTGFDFLWFVQSRVAMLDVFFLAFGLWGALDVWRERYVRGWALLGLALACKWSALPLAMLAFAFQLRRVRTPLPARAVALLAAPAAYAAAFVPLGFLERGAVPLGDLLAYHRRMVEGMNSMALAVHGYASSWWQWPTLLRPMWFTFDPEPDGVRGIWAGGNPVLFWAALPLLLAVAWRAVSTRDAAARTLAGLYWLPLLFWAAAPRKLQFFYYYLPSSMWVGPVVVWAHDRFHERLPAALRRPWLPIAFVLICAACFFWFLPILDAWLLPPRRFMISMWLRSWI